MISFGHIADVSKRTNFTSLPQISTSGNNVYLVWQANTANNSDIYFRASKDAGATFGSIINLSRHIGNASSPQISTSGNRISLLWLHRNNNNSKYEVYFMGATFGFGVTILGSIINLSHHIGNASSPQISTSGNNVYLVWQANTANNSDIYFKHVSSSLIVQYNK